MINETKSQLRQVFINSEPEVLHFAILATRCKSLTSAITYICDTDEGLYLHPYVGYLKKQKYVV